MIGNNGTVLKGWHEAKKKGWFLTQSKTSINVHSVFSRVFCSRFVKNVQVFQMQRFFLSPVIFHQRIIHIYLKNGIIGD